jgi:hypothetical protein
LLAQAVSAGLSGAWALIFRKREWTKKIAKIARGKGQMEPASESNDEPSR